MDEMRAFLEIMFPDSIDKFRMGDANRGKDLMVFDWELAAKLIVEHNPEEARAGLRSDWGATGGPIWTDGKPIPQEDTYTYLASTWAVPELDIDGEIFECYRMEKEVPGWGSDTYWPPEALRIVGIYEGEVIETNLLTDGESDE